MNRRLLPIFTLLASFGLLQCATAGPVQTPPAAGHGALAIAIVPNPIVATRVTGDVYDFPFDVRVSNPGSLSVTIDEVRIDVTALGGIRIHSESKTAADIQNHGYPTLVPAGETLFYRFSPRKDVPSDRLFDSVSALLTAYGTDSSGREVSASNRVSVTRR
jgi:hypothetical protein